MRLDKPRVQPLGDDQLDDQFKKVMGDEPLNIFRTLGRHPGLLKRWLVFGNHVMAKGTLTPRDRELAILRVGWLCRSGYEWGQHVAIGKEIGLSDADIDRVAKGPDAEGWTAAEAALLRATDELHEDQFVSDATWAELTNRYSTEQLMDLIFAVGQYHLVSMALNTLGVQLEEGVEGLPKS